ncbi:MAG: hypothetical protein V7641_1592 [Blastocatellia bacterium]
MLTPEQINRLLETIDRLPGCKGKFTADNAPAHDFIGALHTARRNHTSKYI